MPTDGGTSVLTDEDLRARLSAQEAIASVRRAVVEAERGALVAPARASIALGDGRLVFTAGALADQWFGYRSYDTFERDPGSQVTILHDWATGAVRALALGKELGARRTGALGALAVDLLSRADAARVGLIGAGVQAWAQLWAIASVRRVEEVAVYCRSDERRRDFVRRANEELGLTAREAESAQDAAREKDVVILATTSPVPVLDPSWLARGAHVTSLGPKQKGRAEFDARLAALADVVATDSLAQAHDYQPPFVLEGTDHMARLVSLGRLIESPSAGRLSDEQITLYCSVGLAGSELQVLADLVGENAG